MVNEEALSEFLKKVERVGGNALVVTRKQRAADLAKTIHALIRNSHLCEPEFLTKEELEAFLCKRIQENKLLIMTFSNSTPDLVAGYLNTLFKFNRFQVRNPSGWETIASHPKFKILVVAEEEALKAFGHLVKKTHFLHRYYETNSKITLLGKVS